jgi:hypothetical protein
VNAGRPFIIDCDIGVGRSTNCHFSRSEPVALPAVLSDKNDQIRMARARFDIRFGMFNHCCVKIDFVIFFHSLLWEKWNFGCNFSHFMAPPDAESLGNMVLDHIFVFILL